MLTRVSHIETFRRWRDWRPRFDGDVEPTLEETVAKIVSHQPSEAMLAGSAFHAALETAAIGEHDRFFANGYGFRLPDAEIALPTIRELRAFKAYGALTVTGKADCVHGRRITDHKTTSRFDPENYLAGCQWRFYLDLFEADSFTWHVFELKEDGPKSYRVSEPHVLTAHRYPELERDCADLAGEYLEFARQHVPADFDPIADERAAA